MRVLHLLRSPGDEIAYAAIRAYGEGDHVRVVLLGAAASEPTPPDIRPVGVGPGAPAGVHLPRLEYDDIMSLVEWSEKVVAW